MTDDIVAFIRARINEDEAIARAAEPEHPRLWTRMGSEGFDAHIVRQNPNRTLRGVEAKRRMVNRHEKFGEVWCDEDDALKDVDLCGTCAYGRSCNHCFDRADLPRVAWPCPDLRDLASEWPDHADYRAEWAA